jgi:uncharacterized membrane protein YfcA
VTFINIILLAAAGFAAGAINAVAGGGTFFTFAALVATGLPTVDANATSAVALIPGYAASSIAYREEVKTYYREMIVLGLIGVAGGIAGAYLLIWLGDAGFRPLVPWLLLMATLLFAFSAKIRAAIAAHIDGRASMQKIIAYGFMVIVSIYGGLFGAGMGIILLAVLAVIESGNFHKSNAIKGIVSLVIQVVSGVVLIAGGLVHWPHALVTMAASVVGGYLGVSVARRVPEKAIRATVVTVGAVLTVVFFLK